MTNGGLLVLWCPFTAASYTTFCVVDLRNGPQIRAKKKHFQAYHKNRYIYMYHNNAAKSRLKRGLKWRYRECSWKLQPKVTLFTTHCYGGGCSCSPNLNVTTIATATEDRKSRSWTASSSTGRVCESEIVITPVEKLTLESKTNLLTKSGEDLSNIDFTEQQSKLFIDFIRTVYQNLVQNVDRRGAT